MALAPDIDFEIEVDSNVQPSRTYRVDFELGRIVGTVDGLDAIRQAIGKIFITERFKYLIYDASFGIELEDIIDKNYPPDYVSMECERVVREAFQYDDRVLDIRSVKANVFNDSVTINVELSTIYGDLFTSKQVSRG